MRYMLLIYSEPDAWPSFPPDDQERMMGEYLAFTQRIAESGELIAGEPLKGIDTATAVRVREGRTTSTDGPFAETKEVLGGYYLVDVPDLDRAIELAAQIPDARFGTVEVRPVMDIPGS